MREEIMQALAQALSNNVGNKLTPELATGIASSIHHLWLSLEESEKAAKEE
jgi:hypothetical protein